MWCVHCGTSFPPWFREAPPSQVRALKNPLISARPGAASTPGIGRGSVYEISRLDTPHLLSKSIGDVAEKEKLIIFMDNRKNFNI
jgi:hypothetical protein